MPGDLYNYPLLSFNFDEQRGIVPNQRKEIRSLRLAEAQREHINLQKKILPLLSVIIVNFLWKHVEVIRS